MSFPSPCEYPPEIFSCLKSRISIYQNHTCSSSKLGSGEGGGARYPGRGQMTATVWPS